jgi:hypothetical protein
MKRGITMKTIDRELGVAGVLLAISILVLTINSDASQGDFYTSYTYAKVIAHVPTSGGSPQQMFLQQVGRREYLYLQQMSSRGFTVIDVSKPAKPKVVTHVPGENLTLVASGLAIAEAPGSTAVGSSGADENAEGTREGGSAP